MADDFDSLDDEIKKLVAKADKIVLKEELEKDRFEALTALRTEDGSIKIKLRKTRELLSEKIDNLDTAKRILDEHGQYFSLLEQHKGEKPQKLQEILKDQIDDYSWGKYSKIQDELYKATGDKSEEELEAEIEEIREEINQLEKRRSDLVDNALLIIKDIDTQIDDVS